jgi:hypothetical protein
MAGTLKKVRFKVAWGNYRVGDEITPNGTLRDWLVGQGYADIVDDAPRTVQTPVNRMTRPTHARKRA